jgi:S-DNA-T family DNA segregation ATPase FtsK/SpoIIIE
VATVALLTLGLLVLVALVVAVSTVKYCMADALGRTVLRKLWRIRFTWRRTALRLGLYQTDQAASAGGEMMMMRSRERILIPRIAVAPKFNGVVVQVKTVGRVGLPEFERVADDLANAWQVRYVAASPGRPGYLRLRITLRDGLRQRTVLAVSPDAPVDLRSWQLGHDRELEPVTIRTSDVSGIAAGGLSGTGKTVLVRTRFVRLAPSSCVQFAMVDGKDYELEDLAPRAWLHAGASIEAGHAVVKKVHDLMIERRSCIRAVLGRKNFWDGEPTVYWPLVLLIMDESHTYLFESKFRDRANQDRDTLVRDIIWRCDELVREGRSLGFQCMFLTQKPTGEAIPTKIRDNCQIAMSFAQRSTEAAKAALGDDIADYPHAHPRRLQDPAYVGVLSVVADGRPGYTLVRTPFTRDSDAADLAIATAGLVVDPLEALREHIRSLRPVPDLEDTPA